jgi:hypothetical protein
MSTFEVNESSSEANEREWLRVHSALERRLRPGKGERGCRLLPRDISLRLRLAS